MEYDKDVSNISYETSSVYGNGHFLYYKNVLDVLRGISDPETNGREGLKSLEIIIAAYQSSVTERVVFLPLKEL